MKTYVLFITLFSFLFCSLYAKIKNGYEPRLLDYYETLQKLELMLRDTTLSNAQWRKIKARIQIIENYILYYQLTEDLLHQLKVISPDIYGEIDTITDKRGRTTDVYIKLIPKEEATIDLQGSTFFDQVPNDVDRNTSVYGEGTVSIKLLVLSNTLSVLCHELGHVKYIVPNLAAYATYYNTHYKDSNHKIENIGHNTHDESGKSALVFEHRFRKSYSNHLRNNGARMEPIVILMQKFRKNNQHLINVRALLSSV